MIRLAATIRLLCRRVGIALALLLLPGVSPAIWVGDSTSPYQAQAPLNFSLTIDKFLYLQVGSAGALIDTVSFDIAAWVSSQAGTGPSPVGLGNGVPIPASANGSLTIVVRGNNGAITLAATNSGGGLGIANGSGQYLNYGQIITVSDNAGLPAPVLSNTGSTSVTVAATAFGGRVTNQTAIWSYRLANTVVPAPGNYTGSVTYTAAMP